MTLTAEGFTPLRLPEIKEGIESDLSDAFGKPDLRAESIWGQQVGIYSELHALLWQLSEDVYLSQYPDTATGISLDHVCALTGIVRIPATPTQVIAQAYGLPGTRLVAGREAANERTGDVYRSTREVVINAENSVVATLSVDTVAAGEYTVTLRGAKNIYIAGGGDDEDAILAGLIGSIAAAGIIVERNGDTLVLRADKWRTDTLQIEVSSNLMIDEIGVNLPMLAVDTGAKILAAGSLTDIRTPVAGWKRAGNLDEGITGTNLERDGDFRARRQKSIQITATNTLDSITARLRQTQLVTDVAVYENPLSGTDGRGIPRQHIWAIVEGGDDLSVAKVIYNTRAGGIGMKGDVEVMVRSDQSGRDYPIRFDRPTYVDPEIKVIYTELEGAPEAVDEKLRDALAAHVFGIGDSVIYSRIWGVMTCAVPGVQIDDLTISSARANLLTDADEKVRFLPGNIVVERL